MLGSLERSNSNMSENPNQNGNEENGDVPEIELIIKVGSYFN